MQQLTPKECALLKDLKDQEKLCADKYTRHATAASDAQLKNLFTQIAQTEQQHYQTLCQIENGTLPQNSGNGTQNQSIPTFQETYTMEESTQKKNDAYFCTDVLATEKHASHLYDTCVFEFSNEQLRQQLNHIQSEEQNHGKAIYDYMKVNHMYS